MQGCSAGLKSESNAVKQNSLNLDSLISQALAG
jgi:hypothetical protein